MAFAKVYHVVTNGDITNVEYKEEYVINDYNVELLSFDVFKTPLARHINCSNRGHQAGKYCRYYTEYLCINEHKIDQNLQKSPVGAEYNDLSYVLHWFVVKSVALNVKKVQIVNDVA